MWLLCHLLWQDSPFLRRRRPEDIASRTTPWLASILKSFFINQCERNIQSAAMYESCAKQALHADFYACTLGARR